MNRAVIPVGDGPDLLQEEEDAALMAKIREGDHEAFAILVRRHTPRFYALAARLCFDREEAEDIVQEAFLKVWRSPEMWDPSGAPFTAWFAKVVTHRAFDLNKKQTPYPMPEEADIEDDSLERADEAIIRRRRPEAVKRALMSLPERQRAAVTLCFYEDKTGAEAADVLGVHPKALQSLLMRAKAHLKLALKEYY